MDLQLNYMDEVKKGETTTDDATPAPEDEAADDAGGDEACET